MAYNLKNALVNLNEEIRKNNSGGDLPAVKLAVSQLQISMTAVKSSVANVSAEVDRIKEELAAVAEIQAGETKIGKWGSDDLYRKVISFDSLPNTSTKTVSSGLTGVIIRSLAGVANSTNYSLALPYADTSQAVQSVSLFYDYANNAVGITTGSDRSEYTADIIVEYTKTSNQKKKGGKK